MYIPELKSLYIFIGPTTKLPNPINEKYIYKIWPFTQKANSIFVYKFTIRLQKYVRDIYI